MNEKLCAVGHWRGLVALSPIFVFLCMYLLVSVVIGDFYRMPLSVAFIVASVWGVAVDRGRSLSARVRCFSRAAGSENIVYMLWIFMLAGAFASLAKELGAIDATVMLTLKFLPSGLLLPGLFVAACFISVSIGTSVGTVVALVPLAVELAQMGGNSVALFTGAVLGGAFFGDNLSFISDTTIAATRSQGVAMSAKFKANLRIVLPAAVVTLGVYAVMGSGLGGAVPAGEVNGWLILPYLVVIGLAVWGVNVLVVLVAGIVSAVALGVIYGRELIELAGFMGAGIDSMGDLIVITLLSAGMLGVIKEMGGIDYLLGQMGKRVRGVRGAMVTIGVLTGVVNVCTANNTVTILTVGGVARRIAERYGIDGARTASLLDTCSCIAQCLLPYGAQTLLAAGLAGISPGAPWPYLYYPWALTVCVAAGVFLRGRARS